MARNVFDEDENYWDEPKAKSMWDDSEEDSFQDETKSLKLNFRINPKIAAISAVSILSLIAVISIVPGLSMEMANPNQFQLLPRVLHQQSRLP